MKKLLVDGSLGKDSELVEINGSKFVKFCMANDEFINGEKVTTWYDVLTSNVKVLNSTRKYLLKGARVLVQGDYKQKVTTSPDGRTFNHNDVFADWVGITMYAKGSGQSNVQDVRAAQPTASSNPFAQQSAVASVSANVPPITMPKMEAVESDNDLPF